MRNCLKNGAPQERQGGCCGTDFHYTWSFEQLEVDTLHGLVRKTEPGHDRACSRSGLWVQVRANGVKNMWKISKSQAMLVRVLVPTLALAAGSSLAQAQCTGFSVTSATGASIVPGTTDSGNHTDDGTTPITFPFGVSLYGTSYNTAQVCSNGNIQFTTAGTYPEAYGNDCLSAADRSRGWRFSRTGTTCADGTGGGVFSSVSGVAPNRVFNLEWRATYYPDTVNPELNFELRLFEDNSTLTLSTGRYPQGGSSSTVYSRTPRAGQPVRVQHRRARNQH